MVKLKGAASDGLLAEEAGYEHQLVMVEDTSQRLCVLGAGADLFGCKDGAGVD